MYDFSTKKLHRLKAPFHKTNIFCVMKLIFFFLQRWDFLPATLFPDTDRFFSACQHTSQHGIPNFQTVTWPIKPAFTEPNLNFTKQRLGSKFGLSFAIFQLCGTSIWFSVWGKGSTMSGNIFFSLARPDCFLVVICNIFIHFSFQQHPGPRSERPGLHHLYLLHPVFPTVLLDLTNATDKVIASAGEFKWWRDYLD